MRAIPATILAGALACSYGAANAWFFFWLPLGAIQTAVEGGTCLPSTAKPGDKIPYQGREYRVTATNGTSSRCTDPRWPVIGKIELVLTEDELRSEQRVCLMQGAHAGMKTTVPGLGEVVVRSIEAEGCSDVRQVSARVVRAGYATPAPAPAPAPAPILTRVEASPAPTATKSTADKLRDLKQLRDENLITQELYEAKQRDILNTP